MFFDLRNSTRAWLKDYPHVTGSVLNIGLVNNMPDAALDAAEQQFSRLLSASADAPKIALHFYTLSGIARGEAARAHLKRWRYRNAKSLREDGLDAVIVTGTEPLQADLRRESYWPELASVFDHIARDNIPALFSCLAAHAAVLHFDCVARRRLARKTFGVFAHDIARHPLTAGLRAPLAVAHSRWNELPADALEVAGYRVLTHAPETGADLFVKSGREAWLFFQGHPEYDAETLGREYRRDVRRYLTGESDTYPELPQHYFNAEDETALRSFRAKASAQRNENLLQAFPALRPREGTHSSGASHIVSAWLKQIASRRAGSQRAITAVPAHAFEQATSL